MSTDDADARRLYGSLRTIELHLMHTAFMLDLDAAESADTKVFCLGRIRLIRTLLRERGAELGVIEEVDTVDRPPSITCPFCGKTSYHPKDIEERYCGHCHRFRTEGGHA